MVTIKDIAKVSGVAPSTVSYSLNNDSRIPEETRQKVLAAAQQLGYKGRSGRKPVASEKKQIVLCINSFSGTIYEELTLAIREVLKSSGCEFLIYLDKNVTDLKNVDGILMLNSRISNDSIRELVKRKVPVVVMDRNENIDGAVSVTLDNLGGCYEVTKRAIALGAKSFCFVSGPNVSYESKDRFAGFKAALEEAGIDNFIQLPGDFTVESGKRAATFMLSGQVPDAVICANDEMAEGVYAVISASEQKVPLICGFDGTYKELNHDFITAKASRSDWGHNAVYVLLNLLNGASSVSNSVIKTKLIEYRK